MCRGNTGDSIGGDFVHDEMAQSIRFSSANRDTAASLIASAMTLASPYITSGIKHWDGGNSASPSS